MIRPTIPDDQEILMEIAVAIGLFTEGELEELGGMLTEYFNGGLGEDHFWLTYDDGGPTGVAYYAPEPYTYGTWNLYFIAVHPQYQGQGIGTKLVQYVEQKLATQGERLLLIETSGLAKLEGTRAFYSKLGYHEEARIREFYRAGEDKIIFRKVLDTLEINN